MKAILAALLSFAMFLSLPAAAAAGGDGPVMTAGSVTAAPGQSVEVPIRLSGNTGLAGCLLTVSYGQGLTLMKITKGDALSSMTMTPPGDLTANPVNILWDGTDADDSDGIMALLRFTAPEQPGRYEITLSYEAGNMVDNQLAPVPVALLHGAVIVEGEEEPGGTPADGPVIAADSVTAAPGQLVEVPIRLSGNTGLAGCLLTVSYGQGLILTKITKGDALSGMTMTPPGDLTANPVNILWDGMEEDHSDGVMAVLQFAAPSQPGEYSIGLSYKAEDVVDGDLDPVAVALTSGKITVKELHTAAAKIELSGSSSSSAEILLTNLGKERLTAFCIVAAYNEQAQMVNVCVEPISLDGENTQQISLVHETEADVYQLKVFLLAPNLLTPLQETWNVILSEHRY